MTVEMIEAALIGFTLIWSVAGIAWLAGGRRADMAYLNGQLELLFARDVVADKELADLLNRRDAYALVGHSHESHTHELVPVSEHQEGGAKVVVKKCATCAAVFRDKQV